MRCQSKSSKFCEGNIKIKRFIDGLVVCEFCYEKLKRERKNGKK